jgi:hypothetical protein
MTCVPDASKSVIFLSPMINRQMKKIAKPRLMFSRSERSFAA